MSNALADMPLMWACKCGKLAFNHYTHCAACGSERPVPLPPEPPSDTLRAEPPAP